MTTAEHPNGKPSPSPEAGSAKPTILDRIFLRLKEVLFLGGVGLLVIASIAGGSIAANSANAFGMAGWACGLAVAGGLCFVATALVHRREDGRL
jgi:hypothetical protein